MPLILKKVLTGVGFGLLVTCGLLYWSHGRVTEANAKLTADLTIAEANLAANEEALADALREIAHTEKIMEKRIEAERRIQNQVKSELQRTSAELARLRQEHEDVKAFLAIPVPRSFVDWMRGQGSGNDKDAS